MSSLQPVIEALVRSIVRDPEAVSVEERPSQEGDDRILYEIRVAKDDIGRVVGREGRVIRALRTLARAAASAARTPHEAAGAPRRDPNAPRVDLKLLD